MNIEKNTPVYGSHVYEGAIKIPLITPNFSGKNVVKEPLDNTQLKSIILNNEFTIPDFCRNTKSLSLVGLALLPGQPEPMAFGCFGWPCAGEVCRHKLVDSSTVEPLSQFSLARLCRFERCHAAAHVDSASHRLCPTRQALVVKWHRNARQPRPLRRAIWCNEEGPCLPPRVSGRHSSP